MFSLPTGELATLAVALLLAGALTGILAGLFGVGGGAIIVPILYQVFAIIGAPEAVRMPLAVGTSLAIIIPTSLRSFLAHRATGVVDMKALRLWTIPCFLGVIAGSAIAAVAPPWLFKIVFVAIAGLNGIQLLVGGSRWRIADDLPGRLVMRIMGFFIGILSALMGISGGMLSNVAMVVFGRSIHQAVATSAGLGIVISIPGAIGYVFAGLSQTPLLPPLSIGFVSLIGFALLAPLSVWFAPLGARIAHSFSKRRLEIAYGTYLLIMAGRFLINLI
jgi:uncharacterized membrane protein YfcA